MFEIENAVKATYIDISKILCFPPFFIDSYRNHSLLNIMIEGGKYLYNIIQNIIMDIISGNKAK